MGVFVQTFVKAMGWLSGSISTGPSNEALAVTLADTRGQLVRAVNQLVHYIAVLTFIGRQEYGAWKGAVGRGAGVGADITAIVSAEQQQWHRLLNDILPASLRWLEDDIAKRHLGDLSKRIAALEKLVHDLYKWRAQITNWQGRVVNPTLESYSTFWQYFNARPKAALDVWVRWFEHPNEYADWSTPILAQTLVAYLAHPEAKILRDTLAGMMVDAWTDDANAVWQAMERWLTSNT